MIQLRVPFDDVMADAFRGDSLLMMSWWQVVLCWLGIQLRVPFDDVMAVGFVWARVMVRRQGKVVVRVMVRVSRKIRMLRLLWLGLWLGLMLES